MAPMAVVWVLDFARVSPGATDSDVAVTADAIPAVALVVVVLLRFRLSSVAADFLAVDASDADLVVKRLLSNAPSFF